MCSVFDIKKCAVCVCSFKHVYLCKVSHLSGASPDVHLDIVFFYSCDLSNDDA